MCCVILLSFQQPDSSHLPFRLSFPLVRLAWFALHTVVEKTGSEKQHGFISGTDWMISHLCTKSQEQVSENQTTMNRHCYLVKNIANGERVFVLESEKRERGGGESWTGSEWEGVGKGKQRHNEVLGMWFFGLFMCLVIEKSPHRSTIGRILHRHIYIEACYCSQCSQKETQNQYNSRDLCHWSVYLSVSLSKQET